MRKYSLGLDFGTLSARALLLDLESGAEAAVSEFVYPHGILSDTYFRNAKPADGASLQHPQDYLDALQFTIRDILKKAAVSPSEIFGLGIDFTACTALPVTADGTPVCFLEAFQNEPQAYVKLWNCHSSHEEAVIIQNTAIQRKEPWLDTYSGNVLGEWLFPKLYEILRKAPDVYEKTVYFMEAADWLTWLLTGNRISSSSFAGFKGLWNPRTGHPGNDFWASVDPRLDGIIGTKIGTDVCGAGGYAGKLSKTGQTLTGLTEMTAVSLPIIDAHAPMCASGIVRGGIPLLILGTSSCQLVLDKEFRLIEGASCCIQDGVLPGFTAYEGSQASMGDTFAWFMKNCVPASYTKEANQRGISIFTLMDEKAACLTPGCSGLLALDWWNGNRAPYADLELSGMILGLTLHTKPEEIYRALIESCAFAARMIIELYKGAGITINEFRAGGGIVRKNPMLMQIYADVLGHPIRAAESTQSAAKGSAIFAAVASGCFPDIESASAALSDPCETVYIPDKERQEIYDALYAEYAHLSAYFAKNGGSAMHRLRRIQKMTEK